MKEIRKRIDGWKMVEECDSGLENNIRVRAETKNVMIDGNMRQKRNIVEECDLHVIVFS